MKLYTQLTNNERNKIEHLYNVQHKSISAIAKELSRNKSTISRELKRNKNSENVYNAETANQKYKSRQKHKHIGSIFRYDEFCELFLKFYDKRCFGIEATHHKITTKYPHIKAPSSRQIFNRINQGKWCICRKDRLRYYYKKGKKRTVGMFSKLKCKFVLPYWVRDDEINKRLVFGHYEVDLIVGRRERGFANLITLTERMTRITYIAKLYSKNPMKCIATIYKLIKANNIKIKSITCDNGLEFEKIGLLAKWLNIKAYICEPYASYQRGSNEHINGIIRRFYRKGTNFSPITDDEILEVQNMINSMPRKMFGWKSSTEYAESVANQK